MQIRIILDNHLKIFEFFLFFFFYIQRWQRKILVRALEDLCLPTLKEEQLDN